MIVVSNWNRMMRAADLWSLLIGRQLRSNVDSVGTRLKEQRGRGEPLIDGGGQGLFIIIGHIRCRRRLQRGSMKDAMKRKLAEQLERKKGRIGGGRRGNRRR